MSNQLLHYIELSGLSTEFQSAYRKHHSTETALLRVMNDIINIVDRDNPALLVLLDLSAAFDTVDHSILLERLSSRFGITGCALEWFTSYLTGRLQSVTIDDVVGAPSPVSFGVPQGSVLGPLLFTLYTAPIADIARRHGVSAHFYADDTQLYAPLSGEDSVNVLVNCINDISEWMTDNYLKLNSDKTDVAVFGTSHMLKNVGRTSINVCGLDIPFSDSVKNLGCILDSKMTMYPQVKNVSKQIMFHLRNIRNARSFLDTESTKLMVNSFVTSRLDYCNSLLAGVSSNCINILQKIQNSAARIITYTKRREHITPQLIKLHWLPIEKRINFKILSLMFKCKEGDAPKYLSEIVQPYTPQRSLRSKDSHLFVVPRNRLVMCERSFSNFGPRHWNSLDINLKTTKSFDSFKRNLKTSLFKSTYSL